MIERCIQIAAIKHNGILDQAGEKSIYHLVRVMTSIKHHGEVFAAVGVLHDTIEDTSITYEQLEAAMIDEEVIEALRYTTRMPDETYFDYIKRGLDGNNIFPIYKLADIDDHISPERIGNISGSLIERYKKASNMIRGHQREKSLENTEYTTDRISVGDGVVAEYIGTSKSYNDDKTIHYVKTHCSDKTTDVLMLNHDFYLIDNPNNERYSMLNIELIREDIFNIDGELNDLLAYSL